MVIGLATFGVYILVELVGGLSGRRAADEHGRAVARLEHSLGIDVEAQLNRWLAPHKALTVVANYEYAFGYLAATAVLIIWGHLRRPLAYPFVRSSFILLNLAGIACFLLYPLTPRGSCRSSGWSTRSGRGTPGGRGARPGSSTRTNRPPCPPCTWPGRCG